MSRRRKAEAEAEALMKFMKDEDETAEEMNVARRESSQRLMHCMEPYTVLVVQNFLLETGALTEIRDELYGEFKVMMIGYLKRLPYFKLFLYLLKD